jgi:hypothetical protein
VRSVSGPSAWLFVAFAAACESSTHRPPEGNARPLEGRACSSSLARVQEFDPARAARGQALLQTTALANGLLPEFVVRNLWVAWGTAAPATDAEYWKAFRERYGMLDAPFDNGGLPLGVRRRPDGITFDCMVCHGGRVAGSTILGAPNTRLDLESLYDDLLVMRDLAPMFGFPQPPVPYDLDGFTSAAGAQDAFGLGFRAAKAAGVSDVNTVFGPERAPAWWLLHYKKRAYVDGSADASGHRANMATLVALGFPYAELPSRESDFEDIAHYIRSLESPCWTLTPLDARKVTRGEAIFDANCASCHGGQTGPSAAYPDKVVDRAEVGTDPLRAVQFRNTEATYLNASWFGQPPLTSTGGYLAPPMVGIWARAPYFHNGSVPDLMGLLDSRQRPARWTRSGTELGDYDPDRVGFRYQEVSAAPIPTTREGRLVYDTTRPGMSNGGHQYGDALGDDERADLLEYLRSL